MGAPKPLSPKQLKFVELYLKGSSAKQAYIDAGYAARGHSAEVNAERLLRNAEVSRLVVQAREKGAETAEVTAAWVVMRLKREALRGKNPAAARVNALSLLGRTLGMFVDRKEIAGAKGGPVVVDMRGLPDDDLVALDAILSRAAVRGADPGGGAGGEGPPPAG